MEGDRKGGEKVEEDIEKRSPSVDEFEQKILNYKDLIDLINEEPECMVVGSVAVYTGKLYKTT